MTFPIGLRLDGLPFAANLSIRATLGGDKRFWGLSHRLSTDRVDNFGMISPSLSGRHVQPSLDPLIFCADHIKSRAMAELLTNPTMASMPTAHWSVVPAAAETTAADPIAADNATIPLAMNAARPRCMVRSGIPRPNRT